MNPRIVTEERRLRGIADPVDFDAKTRKQARTLTAVALDPTRRALGLAAPQIGVPRRMFHYNLTPYKADERGGLPPKGIVCNPTILSVSEATWDREEGCLSFPRRYITARRPASCRFEWYDLDGQRHETDLTGMPARVWLHETDHLFGILLTDRAAPGAKLVTL